MSSVRIPEYVMQNGVVHALHPSLMSSVRLADYLMQNGIVHTMHLSMQN